MTKGSLRTLLRVKSSMVGKLSPNFCEATEVGGDSKFLVWLPSNYWPLCASTTVSVFYDPD